jgi:hypothetical protein
LQLERENEPHLHKLVGHLGVVWEKSYPPSHLVCRNNHVLHQKTTHVAIHNGVGYKKTNYRLHTYLTVKEDKGWVPDIVQSVTEEGYVGQYCKARFADSNITRQHRYTCTKNPKGAANMEKKRRREQGEFKCEICPHKVFTSGGGLRNHI